eukprot:jgi/Mesvir1/24529/Mv21869-RA.1
MMYIDTAVPHFKFVNSNSRYQNLTCQSILPKIVRFLNFYWLATEKAVVRESVGEQCDDTKQVNSSSRGHDQKPNEQVVTGRAADELTRSPDRRALGYPSVVSWWGRDGRTSLVRGRISTCRGIKIYPMEGHSFACDDRVGACSAKMDSDILPAPYQQAYPSVFRKEDARRLHLQLLIFKFLMSGSAVPSELRDRLIRDVARTQSLAVPACSGELSVSQSYSAGRNEYMSRGGSYVMLGRSGVGEMPIMAQRCRRTDGKKWQCGSLSMNGKKYCEAHLNRGKKRGTQSSGGSKLTTVSDTLSGGVMSTMSSSMPDSNVNVGPSRGYLQGHVVKFPAIPWARRSPVGSSIRGFGFGSQPLSEGQAPDESCPDMPAVSSVDVSLPGSSLSASFAMSAQEDRRPGGGGSGTANANANSMGMFPPHHGHQQQHHHHHGHQQQHHHHHGQNHANPGSNNLPGRGNSVAGVSMSRGGDPPPEADGADWCGGGAGLNGGAAFEGLAGASEAEGGSRYLPPSGSSLRAHLVDASASLASVTGTTTTGGGVLPGGASTRVRRSDDGVCSPWNEDTQARAAGVGVGVGVGVPLGAPGAEVAIGQMPGLQGMEWRAWDSISSMAERLSAGEDPAAGLPSASFKWDLDDDKPSVPSANLDTPQELAPHQQLPPGGPHSMQSSGNPSALGKPRPAPALDMIGGGNESGGNKQAVWPPTQWQQRGMSGGSPKGLASFPSKPGGMLVMPSASSGMPVSLAGGPGGSLGGGRAGGGIPPSPWHAMAANHAAITGINNAANASNNNNASNNGDGGGGMLARDSAANGGAPRGGLAQQLERSSSCSGMAGGGVGGLPPSLTNVRDPGMIDQFLCGTDGDMGLDRMLAYMERQHASKAPRGGMNSGGGNTAGLSAVPEGNSGGSMGANSGGSMGGFGSGSGGLSRGGLSGSGWSLGSLGGGDRGDGSKHAASEPCLPYLPRMWNEPTRSEGKGGGAPGGGRPRATQAEILDG